MEVPLIFSFNVHNWSKEDKEVRDKVFKQTFSLSVQAVNIVKVLLIVNYDL